MALGGMSDPFQPCEKNLKITKQLLDVTNKYGIHVLFSTKSDTVYDCDIRPDLHAFQLSITNVENHTNIEPNVPSIENRYKFYRELKNRGFKVGIRIQPFIPGVSNLKIVEMFKDADNFTLEGIKIVPQNEQCKKFILNELNLEKKDFTQMGLLNLKPSIRLEMYKPFIEYFSDYGIPFSIADNDLHYIGTNKCCCGDRLVNKSTTFNNTSMIKRYGNEYAKEQLDEEIFDCGVRDCKCNQLFTSNRQEGCISVQDFYDKRFYRKSSPFSPMFQFDADEIRKIKEKKEKNNMELKETVELMNSEDYKERFVAEYRQVKIRHEKLKNFCNKIEVETMLGKEVTKHDCPLELLREQQKYMGLYLSVLEKRALIENIVL